MRRCVSFLVALLVAVASIAHASASDMGAVVLHGKWGSPGAGNMRPLIEALEQAGVKVSAPEMPWSGERLYDATVTAAVAQLDGEIAKLRSAGARKVFVIGQSLGAAFGIHYATRGTFDGLVAIAPGHRTENPFWVKRYAREVSAARDLVKTGRAREPVGFLDLNTGDRRRQLNAPAEAFLSFFDVDGPLNMTRNVRAINEKLPVLWIVPRHEDPRSRPDVLALYTDLRKHAATRLAEPESEHLNAPAASATIVIEWLRRVAAD